MRIGLDENQNTDTDVRGVAHSDGLADLIKDQSGEERTKFSDLSGKKKAEFIWFYYKWWIIVGIAAIIAISIFIRDWRENSKPVYLSVEMLNSYLALDGSGSLDEDFIKEAGIDLSKERLDIGTDMSLAIDNYDTTMIAFQQRLVANYAAGEIDVVIGPKNILEGPANCDCYADFDKIIPEDLMDELKDREYEFYYFDPSKDEIEDLEGEDLTPYCAGVYLDTCAYLNNMGENGAYPVAENEDERIIFTIAGNSQRTDHALEFLRFLIRDH